MKRIFYIDLFLCAICFVHGGIFDMIDNVWDGVTNYANAHVSTRNGILQGRPRHTVGENMLYYSFEGIPYAKPPVGNLRFQPPEPAEAWRALKLAMQLPNECPQQRGLIIVGHEDCLYLNVYTPFLPSYPNVTLRPVMVWIHGGAFLTGSGNPSLYGPDYLLEKDVIVVTFNYRLGILGFLSTEDDVIPGNNGLKDQLMALQWIKENIVYFGGDPERITIFGESSGCASLHFLTLSPLSKGLFHRVICQSGTGIAEWALQRDARANAFEIGRMLGTETTNSRELRDYLLTYSTWRLLFNSALSTVESFKPFDKLKFTPNIEPNLSGAIISEDPYRTMKSGGFQSVPMILGFNSREALFASIANYKPLLTFVLNMDSLVPTDLEPGNHKIELSQTIREFYHLDLPNATIDDFINCMSDLDFEYPIQKTAMLHSQVSSDVFLYRFSFEGTLGSLSDSLHLRDIKNQGVPHYDENGYLFSSSKELKADQASALTRNRMVTMWTNFAKTGNPTPRPDPLLQDVTWPNVRSPDRPDDLQCLDIDENLTVLINPEMKRILFWDNIYKRYRRT